MLRDKSEIIMSSFIVLSLFRLSLLSRLGHKAIFMLQIKRVRLTLENQSESHLMFERSYQFDT